MCPQCGSFPNMHSHAGVMSTADSISSLQSLSLCCALALIPQLVAGCVRVSLGTGKILLACEPCSLCGWLKAFPGNKTSMFSIHHCNMAMLRFLQHLFLGLLQVLGCTPWLIVGHHSCYCSFLQNPSKRLLSASGSSKAFLSLK